VHWDEKDHTATLLSLSGYSPSERFSWNKLKKCLYPFKLLSGYNNILGRCLL
jgi:hypothetical protein